jgi:phage shock protein A
MTGLRELLFGNDSRHPLELDESTHREKQVELQSKRESLTTRRDRLREKKAELKDRYQQARDNGDETTAEEALRKAEEVDDELETVEGKLDVVDQMSQTISNFINVYEMRELRDDAYWDRLMSMDRDELVRVFSEEKISIEEMTKRLDTAGTAADDVVSTFSESTDTLHGQSELRSEWEEEYEDGRSEDLADPNEIFDHTDSSSDEEFTDDLQLS